MAHQTTIVSAKQSNGNHVAALVLTNVKLVSTTRVRAVPVCSFPSYLCGYQVPTLGQALAYVRKGASDWL